MPYTCDTENHRLAEAAGDMDNFFSDCPLFHEAHLAGGAFGGGGVDAPPPGQNEQGATEGKTCPPLDCYQQCQEEDRAKNEWCKELNNQHLEAMKTAGCEGVKCTLKSNVKSCSYKSRKKTAAKKKKRKKKKKSTCKTKPKKKTKPKSCGCNTCRR